MGQATRTAPPSPRRRSTSLRRPAWCRGHRPGWRRRPACPVARARRASRATPRDRRVRSEHLGREQLEPRVEERERLRVRPLEPRRPRLLGEDPVAGRRDLAQRLGEARRRVAQQPLAAGERVGRPPPRERDDDEHAKRQRHDGVERVGPLPGRRARPCSPSPARSRCATTNAAANGHHARPRSAHAPMSPQPASHSQSESRTRPFVRRLRDAGRRRPPTSDA